MGINKAFLLNDIASDLSDYGDWDTDDGGYLDRQLQRAGQDVFKAREWSFKIGSALLTTSQGVQGPYPVSSLKDGSGVTITDFRDLVAEERLHEYYDYDRFSVSATVPDGAFGQRYPITFDRVAQAFTFRTDPGDGAKTVYYRRKFASSSIASWPDEEWLKNILQLRTAFYALVPTEDFAAPAKTFFDLSETAIREEWFEQRKGMSRPSARTPVSIYGLPLYYAYTGDLQGLA